MDNDVINALLVAAIPLITAAFAVAAAALRKWAGQQDAKIEAEIGSANYQLAESLAKNMVHAIEQTMTGKENFTSADKKLAAMSWTRELLDKYGVRYDAQLVDKLVEAAVLGLSTKP